MDSLRQTLFGNLGLKLLSVFLAVGLWVYVLDHENPTVTHRVTVPVVAIASEDRVQVMEVTPDKIEVLLKGRQSVLDEGSLEKIRAVANASGRDFGEYELPLQILGAAPGVTVERMSADTALVKLDTVVTKMRPVMAETRGAPADGFGTVELSVKPNEVQVRGPAAWMQRVARVVAPIDISGQASTMRLSVPLEARDQGNVRVAGLHFTPERVEVTVEIRQVETHTVPVKPILSSPGAGYVVSKVEVDPTTVTLAGKNSPKAVETEKINISGLRGTETYSVPLRAPEGSNVLGVSSAHVTVTVTPASGAGRAVTGGANAPGLAKPQGSEAPPGGPDAPGGAPATTPGVGSGDTGTPGKTKAPEQRTRAGDETGSGR